MPEPLVIEYQEDWPQEFARVEAELRSVLEGAAEVIEHIGSTAVPGLCAKPVIDIALGVASLDPMAAAVMPLARLGFVYRPEYETVIPDRRYFVRAAGPTPRVHLHAVVVGGTLWRQHLRFRDHLRQDRERMQDYATLKRRLAVLHAADKSAYTEAKAPFIVQVLAGES